MLAIDIEVGLEMDRCRGILRHAKESLEPSEDLLKSYVERAELCKVSNRLKRFIAESIREMFNLSEVIQ